MRRGWSRRSASRCVAVKSQHRDSKQQPNFNITTCMHVSAQDLVECCQMLVAMLLQMHPRELQPRGAEERDEHGD